MLKSLLRSAPDRVLDLLSDTMIGRALLRQVVALARKKLGFALDIQPQPGERDLWLVTAAHHQQVIRLQKRPGRLVCPRSGPPSSTGA